MESSSSADQREEEEERHPLLHSPCHFFEQLITSCLKCLGLDHHYSSSSSSSASADNVKTKTDHHQQCPPPQTEMEMKLGEEGVVIATGTARSTIRALRMKRSIGSGSGPQINRASF